MKTIVKKLGTSSMKLIIYLTCLSAVITLTHKENFGGSYYPKTYHSSTGMLLSHNSGERVREVNYATKNGNNVEKYMVRGKEKNKKIKRPTYY